MFCIICSTEKGLNGVVVVDLPWVPEQQELGDLTVTARNNRNIVYRFMAVERIILDLIFGGRGFVLHI